MEKKLFTCLIGLVFSLLIFAVNVQAEVTFDNTAIEARITQLVQQGVTPEAAAKQALAEAIKAIQDANQNYPGGQEALQVAILDALSTLTIPGLETAQIVADGREALGLPPTTAEAYEQGRGNMKHGGDDGGNGGVGNHGDNGGGHGNGYGNGNGQGKPKPGSPT